MGERTGIHYPLVTVGTTLYSITLIFLLMKDSTSCPFEAFVFGDTIYPTLD